MPRVSEHLRLRTAEPGRGRPGRRGLGLGWNRGTQWGPGTRCRHTTPPVAGAAARHGPGRRTASRSGRFSDRNSSGRAAPLPGAGPGRPRGGLAPHAALSPARGHAEAVLLPGLRAAGGVWTGAGGAEEDKDDVELAHAAGQSGPAWAQAEAATRVWASHSPDHEVSPRERACAPPCEGSLCTDPELVAGGSLRAEAPDDRGQRVDRELGSGSQTGDSTVHLTGRRSLVWHPTRAEGLGTGSAEPPSPSAAARAWPFVRGGCHPVSQGATEGHRS